VLASFWTQAFGTSEVALRSLSAIAGAATVPLVYAIGRTLASRRIGLVAAALVATSPYLVFYSQEARAYALLMLLSTAAVLCCARAIRRPEPRPVALWAVVSFASIATHYFAVFLWLGEIAALAVYGVPRRLLVRAVAAVGLASVPLLVLAKHQAGSGNASWIGAADLPQRLRVTVETFALGATFRGSLSHRLLAAFGLVAAVMAVAIAAAAMLLWRRTDASERRAAKIAGLIAAVSVVVPLIGALGPADYFLHKNLIPVLPVLAVVIGVGLGARRAGRFGLAWAGALVAVGASLTVMSFAIPSLRRPDVRQVSQELGPPTPTRVLVFVPRWELALEQYQGRDLRLAAAGRQVTEVDVFTTDDNLPPGTVPPAFRLERVQPGNTFTLFRFRSPVPVRVRPDELARRRFAESGLQPIAVVQTP
jgi:4-amino-4-deoxy-L-arabinose transferase-like glycosyltransferase